MSERVIEGEWSCMNTCSSRSRTVSAAYTSFINSSLGCTYVASVGSMSCTALLA